MKNNKIHIVYFSKNRPLQLRLTLDSFYDNCISKEDIIEHVIYKPDNMRYEISYEKLIKEYENRNIFFIKEGNFRTDLINIFATTSDIKYVMFVVDDTVFTAPFSLPEIQNILASNKDSLGFSLRLGLNTINCYPTGLPNDMPLSFEREKNQNILKFNWKNIGSGDFSYPLEVSSSVYLTDLILPIIYNCNYLNPNMLEWTMYINIKIYDRYTPYLHCYNQSVAFSNPINKVQYTNNNRAGYNSEYSIGELLEKFEDGWKINQKPFHNFVSNGCHQEVPLEFIK